MEKSGVKGLVQGHLHTVNKLNASAAFSLPCPDLSPAFNHKLSLDPKCLTNTDGNPLSTKSLCFTTPARYFHIIYIYRFTSLFRRTKPMVPHSLKRGSWRQRKSTK